jgi:hypothetical protein
MAPMEEHPRPARHSKNAHPFSVAQMSHDQYGGLDYSVPSWDDNDSGLIPLSLLPGQLPRRGPTGLEQSWRDLNAAIIASALHDLASPKAEIRGAAFRWFANADLPVTVSLRTCAEALGLRPQRIARRALRWSGLA